MAIFLELILLCSVFYRHVVRQAVQALNIAYGRHKFKEQGILIFAGQLHGRIAKLGGQGILMQLRNSWL